MAIERRMGRRTGVFALSLAPSLVLSLAIAFAALAAPAALAAGGPPELAAQPLVQAPLRCAAGIVPLNRRCHVIDFAGLGTFRGQDWYYAFYDTHWADRHGAQDRGFPVVFFLEKPATLRLSLWVDDAPGLANHWAHIAPPRPVVIERPDGIYLGLTLKAVAGPVDQRLFRLNGQHWKYIDILHPTPADQARIDAVTPTGCSQAPNWAYDWRAQVLRAPLKSDLGGGDCGVVIADVDIGHDHVTLTGARLQH